jgi:hypothetical protein
MADDPCDEWNIKTRSKLADRLPIACLLILVVSIGWWYLSGYSRPLVGACIAVLAFMAGLVTLWPPEDRWAKAAWLAVFGGLLVAEVSILYMQKASDDEAVIKNRIMEDNRFAGLLTNENTRFGVILQQNQIAFNETMRQFSVLSGLSLDSIKTQTGGDSFCYLVITNSNNPIIIHKGRYPLYGVQVRIVDLQKMRLMEQRHQPINPLQDDFIFNAGDLTVGLAVPNFSLRIPFTDPDKQDFNIFFTAKNGLWDEKLRIRSINANRQTAFKVFRGDKNGKAVTLFESIPKDFPKSELGSDW